MEYLVFAFRRALTSHVLRSFDALIARERTRQNLLRTDWGEIRPLQVVARLQGGNDVMLVEESVARPVALRPGGTFAR